MRPPIDDGHVLITGASSGIGHALALELAPRARVISLVARREDRLLALKAALVARNPALHVAVFACDLLDRAALDRMLDEVTRGAAPANAGVGAAGPVDVLINNAGFGDFGSYETVSWEKTEDMLALNVTVLAYLTRRLLPSMVERRRGGVLNVSSGFGLSFMPGFAGYVGTKHFVTGFTECLRIEMRPKGVVVSQLCPGPVATEFLEIARMGKAKPPGIATVSAEQCARAAVCGFDADRAIIIPGIVMKTVLALGALTPRWVLRLLYRPFVGAVAKASAPAER